MNENLAELGQSRMTGRTFRHSISQREDSSMRKHGFTLIELLIVIAIIAILALIAIPNFLEAQTRSKVSRVMSDQRAVATAVEAYAIDWTRYPCYHHPLDVNDGGANPDQTCTYAPLTLTTPVAFITTLATDPFRVVATGKEPSRPFFYRHTIVETGAYETWPSPGFTGQVNNGTAEVGKFRDVAVDYFANRKSGASESDYSGKMWYLDSIGPDLKDDAHQVLSGSGFSFKYDPTNGTVSNGDVIKWGP
jgi:prepilin-type N-terminal cleavage/methylation domain-containing protein